MITILQSQVEGIKNAHLELFIQRLDHYFLQHFGERWKAVSPELRNQRLNEACERGLALGIETEVYVAQFVIIYLSTGAAFFQTPKALEVIDDMDLDWRQKLYQLTALAGLLKERSEAK